ncbi:MAG: exopolysaccharide biosynthesis polyprenyl glycosylphosphotransferase [Candidatus Omnitrophica bacterium]|nr:exopolysaccharide biosynthesis polyprenyl glycosylphosphotransferase [Candidatus Omnitrophota bacterium]
MKALPKYILILLFTAILSLGTLALGPNPAIAGLAGTQKEHQAGNPQLEATATSDSIKKPLRARAPEPSTIALFFSGFLGMLISFVRQTYLLTKRAIDILLSLLALIILSPIALLIALLIKCTSSGPIFFTQIRVGREGKLFEMYKFRSMKVNAEKESGPVWAKENDPRLIPVGKFLRKSHLDEIPQFINVLRGDMSIVGPRPERPVFVEKLSNEIQDYKYRLNVKPGITGLAQVRHRYDETIWDVRKKVKYDLLYIRNLCLWTDLRILFRTLRVVLTGEGAR